MPPAYLQARNPNVPRPDYADGCTGKVRFDSPASPPPWRRSAKASARPPPEIAAPGKATDARPVVGGTWGLATGCRAGPPTPGNALGQDC